MSDPLKNIKEDLKFSDIVNDVKDKAKEVLAGAQDKAKDVVGDAKKAVEEGKSIGEIGKSIVEGAKPEVKSFVAYAAKMGKWALLAGGMILASLFATYVAGKLGVSSGSVVIPPPPIIVSSPDQSGITPANIPMGSDDAEPLYFCGQTANLAEAINFKPWPNKRITWNIDSSGYRGSLTPAQVVEAFDVAWKAWAKDLDIDPVYVASDSGAMVRSKFGEIDGSGKVLAWSELADGTNNVKNQRYDNGEVWTISANPAQAQIDMVRVAAHEIGHVIGLVHSDMGTGALLDPIYSRTIRFPNAIDVERAIKLGYKRRTTSSQPPPTIQISVAADPEKLAELLRRAGYDVKLIGR